jgi:hypothetical protein
MRSEARQRPRDGRSRASPVVKRPSHTKLHSNSFECKTPKFLKNRQSLIFQKVVGSGFASAIPISFLLKANWYQAAKRSLADFA